MRLYCRSGGYPSKDRLLKRRDIIYRALQGRCGCFCGECEVYVAYSTDDREAQERISRECLENAGKAVSPQRVKCLGCKSQSTSCWNPRCKIRSCAEDKGLEFCYQCPLYACEMIQELFENHPEARRNLKTISKIGPDAWVSSMLARANQ